MKFASILMVSLGLATYASADTVVNYSLVGTGTLDSNPITLTGTMKVDQTAGVLDGINFVANGLPSFLTSDISLLPPVAGLTVTNTSPGQVTINMTQGFIAGQLVDLEAFFGFSGSPDPFLSDLSGTYTYPGTFSIPFAPGVTLDTTGTLVISAAPEPNLTYLAIPLALFGVFGLSRKRLAARC